MSIAVLLIFCCIKTSIVMCIEVSIFYCITQILCICFSMYSLLSNNNTNSIHILFLQ